jgi:hypothetical protein
MDEGAFFLQLLGSVDVVAVAFAITTTSMLKYILFRPPDPGTIDPLPPPAWKTFVGRVLPIMPILFATFYVLAKGYIEINYGIAQAKMSPEHVKGWATVANRGVVSGAMAGYAYRVWKVSILGQ